MAEHWSLQERPGHLRLHTLPAEDFWGARNTLTQRAVGPISTVTAVLDGNRLAEGDVAGLGLLGLPYRWIGLQHKGSGWWVEMFDQQSGQTTGADAGGSVVHLRADCDFLTETAQLSWSPDGVTFEPLGLPFAMVFQLKTFQGIRYAVFAYGSGGGYADFDSVTVDEPHPRGLMRPIPLRQTIRLVPHAERHAGLSAGGALLVEDAGLGRVVLRQGDQPLGVANDGSVAAQAGETGPATQWQWMETPYGEVMLMSLATNRFLRIADDGSLMADSTGPRPDGQDGVRWDWVTA